MTALDEQPATVEPRWRRLRHRPLEVGIVIALACLFLGVGYSTVYRAGFGDVERSDFTVYHAAGRAVLDGTNIYEAQNVRGWLYMYLPIFAVLMVPLAVLPKTLAAGAFFVLSLAALLHLTWLSARLASDLAGAGPPPAAPANWRDVRAPLPPFWVGVAALLLTGWPWMSGLTRGQASVVLSWLTTLSVALFLRDRPAARWTGGFALSLATLIRVFPGLLGLWLLLRLKWRAVLACVVGGLTLAVIVPSLVFGPRGNLDLVRQWVDTVALPNDSAAAEDNVRYEQMLNPRIDKNQSVQATLIRWIAPDEEAGGNDRRETMARRLATGLNLALLLVTFAACLLAQRRDRDGTAVPLLQASAVLVLCLLVPPVSWVHNYSLMILPLAVAIVRSRGGASPLPAIAYRLAVVAWLVGFLACFTEPGYRGGGFLLGALTVWAAINLDLLTGTPRPPPPLPQERRPSVPQRPAV